jgi:putative ABC transport system permease protein
MLRNYFLVAVRYLLRQKLFTTINIIGLSTGIAAFYIIFLYVADEFSYDRFHDNSHRKYRIALERIYPEKTKYYAIVPHSLPEVMVEEIPEVEEKVRFFAGDNQFTLKIDDKEFTETRAFFADSNFFDFFKIPLLYGNPQTLLSDPNAIVLTHSKAKKYFGEENPVGKTLNTEFGEAIITGVCNDLPGKSHMQFNFIGNIKRFPIMNAPLFASFDVYAYVLLSENANPDKIEAKTNELIDIHAAKQIEERTGVGYEDYKAAGNGYKFFLQPITDIHLHSQLELEILSNGNIRYIRLFMLIAGFVLVIACINFMNLSTARSSERAREVGIRKLVGADRPSLIVQHLVESLFVSFISLIIALIIAELTLPVFNHLAGKDLSTNFGNIPNILTVSLIALAAGLLAGLYPAFVISGFQPVAIIKGKFRTSKAGAVLRKGLVIFQFGISILLIILSMFMYLQVRFMLNKDLGFNKEEVVTVPRANTFDTNLEAFRQEILNLPGVTSVGLSNVVLPSGFYFGWQCAVEQRGSDVITTNAMVVDDDFLETMQIEMLLGRDFSKDFNDSLSIIINHAAVKEFGLIDPVGKKLISRGNQDTIVRAYNIIGVTEDFHYLSLHMPVTSFVFFHTSSEFGGPAVFNIRLNSGDRNRSLEQIEELWKTMNPEAAFEYEYLDDQVGRQYLNEKKLEGIFWIFTLLAIVIAAVGLFGLSAYTAQQRTKEFGIRKVFGAGFENIILLLSMEFARLIIIAFFLAIPIGYFAAKSWLNNFEFRIGLLENSYVFLLAGLCGLLIAYTTILFQAVKAAMNLPAESLKYE